MDGMRAICTGKDFSEAADLARVNDTYLRPAHGFFQNPGEEPPLLSVTYSR